VRKSPPGRRRRLLICPVGGSRPITGHTVVVSNSRGPATLADYVSDLGLGAIAGTRRQAAECDVVVLATHWIRVPDALKGVAWRGGIVIDATSTHMDT
jgi:8-hydroxy-5-deazaflavin:NADPH oxidoreductase